MTYYCPYNGSIDSSEFPHQRSGHVFSHGCWVGHRSVWLVQQSKWRLFQDFVWNATNEWMRILKEILYCQEVLHHCDEEPWFLAPFFRDDSVQTDTYLNIYWIVTFTKEVMLSPLSVCCWLFCMFGCEPGYTMQLKRLPQNSVVNCGMGQGRTRYIFENWYI